MKILHRITSAVLFEFETDSIKICLEAAVEAGANLRFADLESANLRFADLRSADLESADLESADLESADLRFANLRFANLRFADLESANLRFADLDFSSGLTFACKTFSIKADLRLAAQIAYHFCRIDFGDCECAKQAQKSIRDLANQFHRVEECGEIKEIP